jgi:hypothetical protein
MRMMVLLVVRMPQSSDEGSGGAWYVGENAWSLRIMHLMPYRIAVQ